ncbi:MAG TPA: hypothetical protein VM286_07380 [Candidatus Thermoplasmatota archaeon]|nr:hypothetical protein [Candidatus Thermoplasmatota archaeon]
MQSQQHWPSPEIRAVLRVGKNSSLAAQEILTMATRVVNHTTAMHPRDPRIKTQLGALNVAMTSCLEGVMELRKASLRGQEQAAAHEILQLCAATLRHGARIAELLGGLEGAPVAEPSPASPTNLLARPAQGR